MFVVLLFFVVSLCLCVVRRRVLQYSKYSPRSVVGSVPTPNPTAVFFTRFLLVVHYSTMQHATRNNNEMYDR
jgi:hypothetical protein